MSHPNPPQSCSRSPPLEARRSLTDRTRVELLLSGTAMVVSALVLVGTVLLLSLYDDEHHRGGLFGIPDAMGSAAQLPTALNHALVVSSNDDEPSLEETPKDPVDIFDMEEDDVQSHRRLKRTIGGQTGERKAEKARLAARAQAKKIQPGVRKDYVSMMSPIINDDPERLVFPSPEAEARYLQATTQFQDVDKRLQLDPLGEFQTISAERVPFKPQVQYLGVLVDAGRHYFPIPWLKRLIVYLHRLRFNLIHFRLTDDQAFNVRLDSYPQLAFSSVANTIQVGWNETDTTVQSGNSGKPSFRTTIAKSNKVYTPNELRDLVSFAKRHNISILPEVNVPGHAGAWAGIKDLVVNCPEFVCSRGYGIPLNVQHPQLKSILKGVIGEVLDIFDNPPLLHLGGDELFMSSPCFKELGTAPFRYTRFEQQLQEVLEELGFPQGRVLRWEETGLPTVKEMAQPKPPRAGTIEHCWRYLPKDKPNQQTKWTKRPFFVSNDLYMDVNHDHGAEDIFNTTVASYQLEMGENYYPTGIVAGAFELGTDFWVQRNVAARLIAVAMGAARLNFTSMGQFWNSHNSICRETLGLDAAVCDLQGYVAVAKSRYQRDWSETWINWTSALCDRLTEPAQELIMPRVEANNKSTYEEANKHFWSTLKKPITNRTRIIRNDLIMAKAGAPQDSHRMGTTVGVLLDLVNAMRPTAQIEDLLKRYIAPLGISLVQLRLADNYAFPIALEKVSRVGYSPTATFANPLPTSKEFAALVQAAGEYGIELFPEVTLSTNAGGWVNSGFALHCPQTFCNATTTSQRHPTLSTNVGKREFLPVVYSVIRELMDIFTTSRFIHLGSDERKSNLACFQEDGRYTEPPIDTYERHLTKLLREYMGMSTQHILRWENEEQVHYPDRTGDITHYRSTNPFVLPEVRKGEPFFVTLDLLALMPLDLSNSVFYEIYKRTRQLMALQPLGILAELRNLDETTWSIYYVGLRLISFRLGTRHERDDYSLEEFELQLIKECRRVQFDHCEILGEGKVVMPAENLTFILWKAIISENESVVGMLRSGHTERLKLALTNPNRA